MISVIIPVRNMAGTITRAIDSAIKAGCQDVIVVDDYSDDNSGTIAVSYPSPHVSVLRAMWGGVALGVCGARNRGIQKARYDWILPLDADDELLSDALHIFEQFTKPGHLIYTGYEDSDGSAALTTSGYHSPAPIGMITRKNVAYATFLFHREDWFRVGGYDPLFNIGGEDWALMLALLNAGVAPIRVDQPIYRRHVEINARTDRARTYWPTIMQLAREKYPTVFQEGAFAVQTHS